MAVRNIALIALYSEQGKILLQHRSKSVRNPNDHLGFFGGGIEAGEEPKATVQREILEELNYKVRNPQLIFTQKFKGVGYDGSKYVFVEKYDPSQPLVQREGLGMQWYKSKDIDEALVIDHDKEALSEVFKFLESLK